MTDNSLDRALFTIISFITIIVLMVVVFLKMQNTFDGTIDGVKKETSTIINNNYSAKNIDNWKVSNDSLNVFYDEINKDLIVDLEYVNSKVEKDFVLFPIITDSPFPLNSDTLDMLEKFKSEDYIAIGVIFDKSKEILGYASLDSKMYSNDYTDEFNQLLEKNKLREDTDSDPEYRAVTNYIYSKALKESKDIGIAKNGLLSKVYTNESFESKLRSDKLLRTSIYYALLFIVTSTLINILLYISKCVKKEIEIKKLMDKYPNFSQLQTELKTFKKSDLNGIYFKNIYIDKLREYNISKFIESDFEYVENIDTYFNSISSRNVTKFYNSLSKIKLIYGDKKLKDEFITSKTFAKDKKILTEDLNDLNDFLGYYPNVFNFYNKLKEKTTNKLKLNSILNDGVSEYSNDSIDSELEIYMDKLNIPKKIQEIIKMVINKEK